MARSSAPKILPLALVLLLAISLAESLLALYQWMELLVVRGGGTAVCALNETVNCAKVWNSSFASALHRATGLPVAGLGLVWGLTAFGLSALLVARTIGGKPVGAAVASLRVTAGAGVVACVGFAVGSFGARALCLTCLGTFALVLLFALVAFKLLPRGESPRAELKSGVAWAAGLAVAFHLALLGPGLATPKAGTAVAPVAASSADNTKQVAAFLEGLSSIERQVVSDARSAYRKAPRLDVSRFPVRQRFGPESAPVKIVEFTDVLCGHCRALVEAMAQIKKAVPPGLISVEARSFPLDGECNPLLNRSAGDGVRCLGAKAQICLEGAPDYWELQQKLFAAQEGLTREKIFEIASSGSVTRERLEACVASPETDAKLKEDIEYARQFDPKGTPLVLLNGKEAWPDPAWLYTMAMAAGDLDSPVFAGLPPPRTLQ